MGNTNQIINFIDEHNKIKDIKKEYIKMKEIVESVQEKPDKYRNLANEVGIDYHDLRSSFDIFAPFLLIKCYTFIEQLLKKFIRIMLENGDRNKNFINKYMTMDRLH